MTPEDRELLMKSIEMTEENNKILRSMRRSMRISSIMSYIYWIVIIGSAFGVYYFIMPYLELIGAAYGDARSTVGGGISNINQLLEMVKGLNN